MEARVTGEDIIEEFVRCLHEHKMPLAYSILVPNYYVAVLHPEDYKALSGVKGWIIEEAGRRLDEELATLNDDSGKDRRSGSRLMRWFSATKQPASGKIYRRTGDRWEIDIDEDVDQKIKDRGDFDVYVEHTESRPGTTADPKRPKGQPTVRIEASVRKPSGEIAPPKSEAVVQESARPEYRNGQTTQGMAIVEESPADSPSEPEPDPILATLCYIDKTGERMYEMTKHKIILGRGGVDQPVDMELYAAKNVSRVHCLIRYEPHRDQFSIKDVSSYGTKVNDIAVPPSIDEYGEDHDIWEPLPLEATIVLSESISINFESNFN